MKKSLDLTIASFDEVEMLAGTAFTKIISIHDAHLEEERGYERRIHGYFPKARIAFSYFDDVDYPADEGPQDSEIELLLAFSRQFGKTDKILIHCRAGISRSTALAYAVLCQHDKPGREKLAFATVRKLRPQLLPNRLVVKIADRLLKRDGNMVEAAKMDRWEAPS